MPELSGYSPVLSPSILAFLLSALHKFWIQYQMCDFCFTMKQYSEVLIGETHLRIYILIILVFMFYFLPIFGCPGISTIKDTFLTFKTRTIYLFLRNLELISTSEHWPVQLSMYIYT